MSSVSRDFRSPPEVYLGVEFRRRGSLHPEHSAIVTQSELAVHLRDYRGYDHVITGFYARLEVAGMSLEDRGLAHLERTS